MMTENNGLEFNNIALQEAANLGYDENDARKYMNRLNRDNIAQVVVLESLQRPASNNNSANNNNNNVNNLVNNNRGHRSLCVVNTHIYSNNQYADVKLWQTMYLLRAIQQFVTPRELAVVICGDFNSEPLSAVYELMMHRAITSEHAELLYDEQRHRIFQILPDLQSIGHNLELSSAMYTALGMEPRFTNFTASFKGTLDYIFYTPSRLKILAVSNLPDEHDVASQCSNNNTDYPAQQPMGLPCASFPSDHLYLSCDVAMVVSGNGSILQPSGHSNNNSHHHGGHGSHNMFPISGISMLTAGGGGTLTSANPATNSSSSSNNNNNSNVNTTTSHSSNSNSNNSSNHQAKNKHGRK
jgi:CCR4-NOT transcription complex subunit 6